MFPVHQFDGARVQTGAGHLREISAVGSSRSREFCLRQVDGYLTSLLNDFPRRLQIGRQLKFLREHVDSAQRQHAEASAGKTVRLVADPVQDFVDRAVPARRHDGVKTFAHGLRSQRPAFAGGHRWLQRAVAGDGRQMFLKALCFLAAGGGIKDHANRPAKIGSRWNGSEGHGHLPRTGEAPRAGTKRARMIDSLEDLAAAALDTAFALPCIR